jgi:uncharacterized phage-associated protein
MATAYSVANELIRLAQAENKQLTPLQIMKMAYLAHGWMLALCIFHGQEPPLDDQESNLIGQVYRLYGGMNGMQLSALTHRPGTPWAQTWSPDVWNLAIPNDLIADYYRRLANERQATA